MYVLPSFVFCVLVCRCVAITFDRFAFVFNDMSECVEENNIKTDSCRSSTSSPVNFTTRSEVSSGYYSSSPPTPNTPQSISPPHTLKRSRSSSFRLINRRISTASTSSQISIPQEPKDRLAALIGWYPSFLIRIYLEIFSLCFFVVFKRLPIMIPMLWLSGCLWLICKSFMVPMSIIKNVLLFLFVPAAERNRKKRTVLISGGSSVQAVHLARNFYSAGARVVMCEVEGYFSLTRYSTAVHKYYTLPKPNDEQINAYIETLKDIVLREEVKYFIPVSEVSTAYYDAVAKPHLEVLGCECICPDLREVLLLDDLAELLRKVQSDNLVTSNFYPVNNNLDLNRLYDFGIVKQEPHFMQTVGIAGCKQRQKINLPNTRRRLRLTSPVNEQNPWLVVQDVKGDRYVTCTTVRESQIVGNVICKIDEFGSLIPIENPEIEQWLMTFFAGLKAHRKIVGHMSFYFTIRSDNGTIYPTGCEVGVRLPYICYTSVQPRIVWKPCRHFSRHTSGPIVTNGGKYWLNEMLVNILEHPSLHRIRECFCIVWGRNDALFVLWDPLPYCIYYYIQLPLKSVLGIVKKMNAY